MNNHKYTNIIMQYLYIHIIQINIYIYIHNTCDQPKHNVTYCKILPYPSSSSNDFSPSFWGATEFGASDKPEPNWEGSKHNMRYIDHVDMKLA